MEKQYEPVIGLEVHVELSTKTKIFCSCSTAFGGEANTRICPVCTGMPGTLPVLNKKVVESAIAVGLALNCKIRETCYFDRKNYFYPDNPQNYQISQLYAPIAENGFVEITVQGEKKRIGIHEMHMEEDAGKLIHDEDKKHSYIDYNRSGVPLLEIVSEPDMSSAEEVIAYLEKLRDLLRYLGVSDCKLQEGSMRADVNLSLREKGEKKLGNRTEMKNLNSFHSITRAIEGEKRRQLELLSRGEPVALETRRWDEDEKQSFSMRSKEDSKDYRYFPEPDLMPVVIGEEWIKEVLDMQPEFREEKQERYVREFQIPAYDAEIITEYRELAELFEDTTAITGKPKAVSNWLMGEMLRLMREKGTDPADVMISPKNFAKLIELLDRGKINNQVAKEVFEKMFLDDIDPETYVEEQGLLSVSDEETLEKVIIKVLEENTKSVQDYLAGKKKAMGFLVGQTMKVMEGKADPGKVNQILSKMLREM